MPLAPKQEQKHPYATAIGYAGLLMWGVNAVLIVLLKNLPVFEVLSYTFGISFLATCLYLTLAKQWHTIKQPLTLWITGFLGVYMSEVFYIAAFKHAPPAQVDLVTYLWPILLVLFSACLPRKKLSIQHILAGLISFSGVYHLLTQGHGLAGFQTQYLLGYIFALAGAIAWVSYALMSNHYQQTSSAVIGLYCGVGMVFSVLIHHYYEPTIPPSFHQWPVIIFMGLSAHGFAYFCWDFGIKRGNFRLLSVLAYTNPLLSVAGLIAAGFTQPSTSLALACFLITGGSCLAGIPSDIFTRCWAQCRSVFSTHLHEKTSG